MFWHCSFKGRTCLSVYFQVPEACRGCRDSFLWPPGGKFSSIYSIGEFWHQHLFNSLFLRSAPLARPFLPSRRHFYKPESVPSVRRASINPGGAGPRTLKQEVPLNAGSFCSSLLLLRLKREELCLLSFLTGVWEPACFPFSSWVVGGALLPAFLLEF